MFAQVGNPVAAGIQATARRLGMDPVDLATIISYETGGTFDPTKAGPTTKWGQHRGLIQFGEPQAKQYGVDWDDPVGSQLGEGGAVERYFIDRGWKPGMSQLDAYSIVNAGSPGRYNASDEAAGGAPGTVRDKVTGQFGPHREKAAAFLGMDGGDGVTMSSRGGGGGRSGGPLDFMWGGDEDDLLFPIEEYQRTRGDRIRGALVGAGEALGALGAGHAATFQETDRFIEAQRLRGQNRNYLQARNAALQGGGGGPDINQSLQWLRDNGHEDLADLGEANPAMLKDLLKEAMGRDPAATPTGIPDDAISGIYESGQNLGLIYRGLTSLQDIMDQMDAAIEAGDEERFRALKEQAQGYENDITLGRGKYFSMGNEASDWYAEGSGVGIPTTLVSEQEINELLQEYGNDTTALVSALVVKYGPQMAAEAGGAVAGIPDWMPGMAVIKQALDAGNKALAATEFNKMRLRQARTRLASFGSRIQGEMTAKENEYRAGTGSGLDPAFSAEGWREYDFDPSDDSDPRGW